MLGILLWSPWVYPALLVLSCWEELVEEFSLGE
jgi:hypothetical protein